MMVLPTEVNSDQEALQAAAEWMNMAKELQSEVRSLRHDMSALLLVSQKQQQQQQQQPRIGNESGLLGVDETSRTASCSSRARASSNAGDEVMLTRQRRREEKSVMKTKKKRRPSVERIWQSRRLWTVALVIVAAIAISFGSAALITQFVFGKGDVFPMVNPRPEYQQFRTEGVAKWKTTDTSPLSQLTDEQFKVYSGFILFGTTELMGIGLELFVWQHFCQIWTKEHQGMWRFAQFVFPLFIAVSVGLAMHQNYLSLVFLVLGMWKFGFPETLMLLYLGLYGTASNKTSSKLQRMVDFLSGIGTVTHHAASALFHCMLLSGTIPPSRYGLETVFPLLMQHWFVLLRYVNVPIYSMVEIALEVWFEWITFSSMQYLHSLSWTFSMVALVMVFAHWAYFLSAGIGLLHKRQEQEKAKQGAAKRATTHSSDSREMPTRRRETLVRGLDATYGKDFSHRLERSVAFEDDDIDQSCEDEERWKDPDAAAAWDLVRQMSARSVIASSSFNREESDSLPNKKDEQLGIFNV